VAAFQIRDLGWCAPVSGPGRPIGPVTVTSWRLERDRPVFVRLRQVAPAAGETRFGALYAPPQACDPGCRVSPSPLPTLDGLASWLTGRYIFRYADAGNGSTAWFAADVEVVPPLIEPLPAESP
jgi:hypothetical protein